MRFFATLGMTPSEGLGMTPSEGLGMTPSEGLGMTRLPKLRRSGGQAD